MSKGFGAVQRKIAEVLAKDSDDAFRVDELCREVYGDDVPEKKQRVAVIRAGKALVKKRPDLSWTGSGGPGLGLVFFHQASVMSYAKARLKALGYSEDRIHRGLRPGGDEHGLIVKGGAYWLDVQEWIAKRDNDKARLSKNSGRCSMPQKREHEATVATLRDMASAFRRINVSR